MTLDVYPENDDCSVTEKLAMYRHISQFYLRVVYAWDYGSWYYKQLKKKGSFGVCTFSLVSANITLKVLTFLQNNQI